MLSEYMLPIYKSSYDIKVFPNSADRRCCVTALTELNEICDILGLDHYLTDAVEEILQSSCTHEYPSDKWKLLYSDQNEVYVGIVEDDCYYLSSNKMMKVLSIAFTIKG